MSYGNTELLIRSNATNKIFIVILCITLVSCATTKSSDLDITKYYIPSKEVVNVYYNADKDKHEYIYHKFVTEDNTKYWLTAVYTNDFKIYKFSKKKIDDKNNVLLEFVDFPSDTNTYQDYTFVGVKITKNVIINLLPQIDKPYENSYQSMINKNNSLYWVRIFTFSSIVKGITQLTINEKTINVLKIIVNATDKIMQQDKPNKETANIQIEYYEEGTGLIEREMYTTDNKFVGKMVLEKTISFDEFKKMSNSVVDVKQ